jgi:hypothetical protein
MNSYCPDLNGKIMMLSIFTQAYSDAQSKEIELVDGDEEEFSDEDDEDDYEEEEEKDSKKRGRDEDDE